MASQGPLFIGTGASVTGQGDVAWTSPTNVEGDTNDEATSAPANGQETNWFRGTNLGFSIPTEATVTGVLMELERRGSNNNRFRTNDVRLVVGGSAVGDNKSAGENWNAIIYQSHEWIEAELAALSLTPAQVNATGFGAQVTGTRIASQAVVPFIRRMRITVLYEESGVPHTVEPADFAALADDLASSRAINRVLADTAALPDAFGRAAETFRQTAEPVAAADQATVDHQPAGGGGEPAPFPRQIVLVL